MDTAIKIKMSGSNLRLKSSAKNLIARAAGFERQNNQPFHPDQALERAEKTVQEHEMMTLNAQNSQTFFDALAAPIRFNRKLIAAFEEYDKRVVSK